MARKNAKVKSQIKSENRVSNKEDSKTVSSNVGASPFLPSSSNENEKGESQGEYSREESQEEDSPVETQTETESEVEVDGSSVDMNKKNLNTESTIPSLNPTKNRQSFSLFLSIPPSPVFHNSSEVKDLQINKLNCKAADKVCTMSSDKKQDDLTDKEDIHNSDFVKYIRATETSMPAIKCEVCTRT